MDTLTGTFDHIIFSNEDNGFTVARILPSDSDEKVTIVGTINDVQPGESMTCTGRWKNHPAHGQQFEIENYTVTAPHTELGIRRYLESGMIRGVGKKYAHRIVDEFGMDTLRIIDQAPHRLKEVEGLGKKRIARIKECWQEQKQLRNIMIFLRSHDVGVALAQKIYKQYGDESIERVKENPYQIASEMFGVGFKTVDKIAMSMGIPHDSEQRAMSGVEFTLSKMADDGHVCAPLDTLIDQAQAVLQVNTSIIESAIETLIIEERLIKKQVVVDGPVIIWLRMYYMAELGIVREMSRIKEGKSQLRSIDTLKALDWVEAKHNLSFAQLQRKAIATSLNEKLHIITGGPGTGKSTITKAILTISEKLTDKILLAAPTGRAAKRMSEITHKKALTIHVLLEVDFTTRGFKRNKDNPLDCDLLIIDEASMIDTFLMYSLLRAIPDHARLILIGDVDQLPSVGAGNVLKDLIDSETMATTMLTEIFRQGKFSRIVVNAHRINHGNFPDMSPHKQGDFHFIEASDATEILDLIVDLNATRLPNRYHFNPLTEIQVLAPMRRGVIGTENLNVALQARLNPDKPHMTAFGKQFRLNDKVMQIRNNYNKNVFNGDVGIIEDFDKEEQLLFVNFDNQTVEYDFTELDELVHAYAVSIHKYQGSECKCIIMPIHTSHFKLLYRNLLYTGITRGKKQVVLVGMKKAVAMAVKNEEVRKRSTSLKELLLEQSKVDAFDQPEAAASTS